MSTSTALKEIFAVGRPLVEQALDAAEQIAALRQVATEKGLDWSQVKALLKAQIADERDESGDGKRVNRIVDKASFASAYADMLGLANMNENNFSEEDEPTPEPEPVTPEPEPLPPHDPKTGEVHDEELETVAADVHETTEPATKAADDLTLPKFLDRRLNHAAEAA